MGGRWTASRGANPRARRWRSASVPSLRGADRKISERWGVRPQLDAMAHRGRFLLRSGGDFPSTVRVSAAPPVAARLSRAKVSRADAYRSARGAEARERASSFSLHEPIQSVPRRALFGTRGTLTNMSRVYGDSTPFPHDLDYI